eukprot:5312485-Prymnesium_polylepis.1
MDAADLKGFRIACMLEEKTTAFPRPLFAISIRWCVLSHASRSVRAAHAAHGHGRAVKQWRQRQGRRLVVAGAVAGGHAVGHGLLGSLAAAAVAAAVATA